MSINMKFHIDIRDIYINIELFYQRRAFKFAKYLSKSSLKYCMLPLFVLKIIVFTYLNYDVSCTFNWNILNSLSKGTES
jgi:hypothetical protein